MQRATGGRHVGPTRLIEKKVPGGGGMMMIKKKKDRGERNVCNTDGGVRVHQQLYI